MRVQVLRNGRLLDDFLFPAGGNLSYTDYLLWPSTGYTYTVRALDAAGGVISAPSAPVATPAQSGSFPRLYAPTSFWNQPIAANPAIDPNSSAMVNRALVPYAPGSAVATSDDWGTPIAYANPASSNYVVGCRLYDCQIYVTSRVPKYAKPNFGSDGHLVVIDATTKAELDAWQTTYNAAIDAWSASSRYKSQADGWGAQCALGQHCYGGVAAGFNAGGGVIRPEEIAQGHIDHALFFFTPATRSGMFACPATSTDGVLNDPAAIPEGARIQLDPTFNVDAQPWPRWQKVIAHALQTYGAYLGDTGGSVAFAAEANLDRGYDAWGMVGVGNTPSISNLPWDRMRVLLVQRC